MSDAVFNMLDVSENSSAAASTIASSAHTFELNKDIVRIKMIFHWKTAIHFGPICRETIAPTAIANK